MITSALISQCRREFQDVPKSTRALINGDGSSTLFNLGQFPVIENSYYIYVDNTLKTDVSSNYVLDKDSGDLSMNSAPALNKELRADFKYAHWRDINWNEAINQAISDLNARGYFRQVVRDTSVLALSANVRAFSGPTNAIDVYELLESDDYTTSGGFRKLGCNWSYQQDANKIVLGNKPSRAGVLATSYLRNLQTYSATSATLDLLNDWVELAKKRAGALFYRSVAGKIAKQGNATIDEGHFSFTNLRTMANDLDADFERMSQRKKPTRPAKDIQWSIGGGGVA